MLSFTIVINYKVMSSGTSKIVVKQYRECCVLSNKRFDVLSQSRLAFDKLAGYHKREKAVW
jgi:hypothetical protein